MENYLEQELEEIEDINKALDNNNLRSVLERFYLQQQANVIKNWFLHSVDGRDFFYKDIEDLLELGLIRPTITGRYKITSKGRIYA